MKTQHTPSPWVATRRHTDRVRLHIEHPSGYTIATMLDTDDRPHQQADNGFAHITNADARLITSAPELLAALKSVVFAWETSALSGDELPPYAKKVRAAIAKAEGR